jgi:hypothetical protein
MKVMKAHSLVNFSTENETGLSDYITAHFFSVILEPGIATLPDSLLGMQILVPQSDIQNQKLLGVGPESRTSLPGDSAAC